jgi:hypothetical protein
MKSSMDVNRGDPAIILHLLRFFLSYEYIKQKGQVVL